MHDFQVWYELFYHCGDHVMLRFTGVIITNPPQDDVVCIGDNVNITCGYEFSVQLAPVWIIGGRTYSVSDIMRSSLYNSPIVTNTTDTVVTVNAATAQLNRTTFLCEFTVHPIVMSSIGTLTVMGKDCIGCSLYIQQIAHNSIELLQYVFTPHRSPNPTSYQSVRKETDLTGNIMGHIQPYLMW